MAGERYTQPVSQVAGATTPAKAEDAAHTSGDTGAFILAVRNDTAAALAGTTGDYIALTTDKLGKLHIAGTHVEDAAHANNDIGMMALTVRQDSAAALSGTDGDYQPPITDANGRLHVIEPSASGMAADVAETNLFTSTGKAVVDDLEFLPLNNTQGTTEVHANTASSRIAFMGLQGTTNTTGATVSIQDRTSGTVLVGPITTVVNTGIVGFPVTGFPYAVSADDTGMQVVVSGAARIDGALQFMEIGNA